MQETLIQLPGLFGKAGWEYHFNAKRIFITDDHHPEKFIEIPRQQIKSLRFNIKGISGIFIPVGVAFHIEIMNIYDEVLHIKFSSYYFRRQKAYFKAFNQMLNVIYNYYFNDILLQAYDIFKEEKRLIYNGVTFTANGVCWQGNDIISWEKLSVHTYRRYFIIRHTDKAELYKVVAYDKEWNALVLRNLLLGLIEAVNAKRSII